MHVEDAASAFVALLESEVQGPVNIGAGRPIVVRDVLQEIGQQIGRPELIHFGARAASSEADRYWANTKRLEKEVAWAPHYNLSSGIANTIDWWRIAAGISTGNPVERAHR
jgi:nucleoside-diphosphate-sugar epimerase